MSRAPLLHNQTTLDDEDFVANFVARHQVLETMLRRLRAGDSGGGLNHILIGPRGMGKTSLLRRLAIGIRHDAELSDIYIPLNFREEQYNVLKVADFWRNCADALAEWAEDNGMDEVADRLDEAMAIEAWATEQAGDLFVAETAKLSRRAVLLVDNIDLILDTLSPEDNWKLRKTLQAPGGPVVVGAATQMLSQASDNESAFYEFFIPHHLDPLDIEETERCMRTLAERRGENGAPVLAVLDHQPERLRTLHRLTGGNPRILTLIYRLLETAESDAAMADLEILLDQVTPYYKARVEEYTSPQQRAIIDAIALHWDPITTGELARRTAIVTTTLSAPLAKLVKDGLIERVETSGSYGAHQLVERFFNIWYLMRHGMRRTKQKMRWLVAFLTCFYSSRELAAIARRARRSGVFNHWHADYASAFQTALRQQEQASVAAPLRPAPTAKPKEEEQPFKEAFALAAAAVEAWRKNDLAQCIALSDALIEEFGKEEAAPVQRLVAHTMLNKVTILGRMGDLAAQAGALSEIIAQYGKAGEPELLTMVAYGRIVRAIALQTAGQRDAAIDLLEAVIAEHKNATSLPLRLNVASALRAIAAAYGVVDAGAEEIATYDRFIAQFPDPEEPELRQQLASVLVSRAYRFSLFGDEPLALAVYDEVIDRFGDDDGIEMQKDVARAYLNKAHLLDTPDNRPRAIETLKTFIERYDAEDVDVPEGMYERITVGQFGLANTLALASQRDAAVEAYDKVMEQASISSIPRLRHLQGSSLFGKALCLDLLDKGDEKVKTFLELIERFCNEPDLELRELVAQAIINLGLHFDVADQLDVALAYYEKAIALLEPQQEPSQRASLVYAFSMKADIYTQREAYEEALLILDDVLRRFGDDDEVEVQAEIAPAMIDRAVILGETGMRAEEIAIYDEVIAKFAEMDNADLREAVARAIVFKGAALAQLERIAEAIRCMDQALAYERADDNSELRDSMDQARFWLVNILIDRTDDLARAEAESIATRRAEEASVIYQRFWIALLDQRTGDAEAMRQRLGKISEPSAALVDAALELAKANFGQATVRLEPFMAGGAEENEIRFNGDFERLLRVAAIHGHGERLLSWFAETGFAERAAPIAIAFEAYVRGESLLLDINPEVRAPAKTIFDRLDAPRRYRKSTS